MEYINSIVVGIKHNHGRPKHKSEEVIAKGRSNVLDRRRSSTEDAGAMTIEGCHTRPPLYTPRDRRRRSRLRGTTIARVSRTVAAACTLGGKGVHHCRC
jgi:hypothetical protein